MACAKRYNVGCSRRMGLFKGLENGNKYHKKPKDLSSHRAWSRSQGGRVSTGPIQRVRAGNTDSDSPPQSETDTDTQSSGATPIPSEPLPASEKVTHPQPALPEAKTPQHDVSALNTHTVALHVPGPHQVAYGYVSSASRPECRI